MHRIARQDPVEPKVPRRLRRLGATGRPATDPVQAQACKRICRGGDLDAGLIPAVKPQDCDTRLAPCDRCTTVGPTKPSLAAADSSDGPPFHPCGWNAMRAQCSKVGSGRSEAGVGRGKADLPRAGKKAKPTARSSARLSSLPGRVEDPCLACSCRTVPAPCKRPADIPSSPPQTT